MLGVRVPPVKPRGKAKTNQRPKTHYTIHTKPNDAFTIRPDEKSQTAIVGFHKFDDAMFIGKMIETYFIRQKELPDTKEAGTLILPMSEQKYDVLHYVYIQEWKFDELKLMCTRNILDVVSVQDIVNSKGGYSFAGVVYKFEAPVEFYQARYDELFKAMTLNDLDEE
jgi:hypothetical protein